MCKPVRMNNSEENVILSSSTPLQSEGKTIGKIKAIYKVK